MVLDLNTECSFKHKNLWVLTAQDSRVSDSTCFALMRKQEWRIIFSYFFEEKLNLIELQKAYNGPKKILKQTIIEVFDGAFLCCKLQKWWDEG